MVVGAAADLDRFQRTTGLVTVSGNVTSPA